MRNQAYLAVCALVLSAGLASCDAGAAIETPEAPGSQPPLAGNDGNAMGVGGNAAAVGGNAAAVGDNTAAVGGSAAVVGGSAAGAGGNAAGDGGDAAGDGGHAAGVGANAMDATTASAGSNAMLPCEVTEALARSCHRCHGPAPANGAPMSLVVPADFERLRITRPRIPMSEWALMRMDGSASPPMPPADSPITDDDKATLIDWLSRGAPAAAADMMACP